MVEEISLSLLIAAYLTCFVGAATPGPNVFAMIETALKAGYREHLSLAIGIACGSVIWGGLTVIGLTAIVVKFPSIVFTLKVLGICVLLWFSFNAFKSRNKVIKNNSKLIFDNADSLKYLLKGILLQAVNPKTAISWFAIYAVALTNEASSMLGALIIIGNVIIAFSVNLTYGLAFSTAKMNKYYKKHIKAIQSIIGFIYLSLAMALLFYKINLPIL